MEEQLSFDFDNIKHEAAITNQGNETAVNKKDLFDCCSHYRECSDAKKCVVADKTYSEFCLYRPKLANGEIIYGKNAEDFDIDVYNQFIKSYNALNEDETILFNSIIHTLLSNYRDSILMQSSDLLETLNKKELIESVIDDELLDDFNCNYIRNILKSNNLLGDYAGYYPEDRVLSAKKDHLLEYIKNRLTPGAKEF